MSPSLTLTLLGALLAQAPAQAPPTPAPQAEQPATPAAAALFSGVDLDGWHVMPGGRRTRFTVAGGVLRVAGDSGWLRSDERYDDFVLTFSARRVSTDGRGGVLVRVAADGLLPPGHRLAYEVPVAGGSDPTVPLMQHHDRTVTPGVPDAVTRFAPDDRWHDYWLECRGDGLVVKRDGAEAARVRGLHLNTGSIGFFATRGAIEFRDLRLTKLPPPPVLPEPSVYEPGTNGVRSPRVLFELKPSYTARAMSLWIQGYCIIECVVEVDGRVRHPCLVRRRLSTGLDAAALGALEQWEFAPGLRDGTPVPVVVLIEVGFALK